MHGLVALFLQGNRLETLPEVLNKLPLQVLWIDGNPKLGIPESIASGRDPQKILRYYFESRREKGRPLQELKVLLVGRGQAGKTTLLKQLLGKRPNKREPETHSIEIRSLTLDCPRGKVQVRAWDFGGQEILHATHQFFLTERSLYLLVLEPRTGTAQRDAEYWLNLIATQGGGSPVIVVMNHSRNRRWNVDEVKLRRTFPFIVEFLSTDALHGEGIEKLRSCITRTVDVQMPDVWLPFPKRWREIKDAVAGMRRNFLTYHQYTRLCVHHGEKDPQAQSDLAEILHALGLALYFGKDPRLHDTRVLNPSWVTGGVYAVIRSERVKADDGQFASRSMLPVLREAAKKQIIDVDDYGPPSRRFILELMRVFQLCYASKLDNGRPVQYLVPELLPEFEPKMGEAWNTAPVRLRYRYSSLPEGLLPRFIVRTHELSDGAPHWRRGVVLKHGDAAALIRAETDRPELNVFVLGDDDETRGVLVAMVRDELDSLHGELKLRPVEELELTGDDEQWISVKALREVETPRRKKQTLPVQPEGVREVNVSRELDKLVPSAARAIDRNPKRAPIPVRVFVSYAHEDERQLKRLDSMLGVLERQHGLTAWHDQRLIAGDQWDEEIRRRLDEMDIFLFIASAASLVSDYIRDVELRVAKRRQRKKEVQIVTVKLEPCAVDGDKALGKLQRLGRRVGSIAETNPRSVAWEEVRKDLLPVIERARERKKAAQR
ncbi:MAG: TIR domain-containing protein [Planctomycetes bacterium]|nr:TIR domain-containing protein [Planctomycetota bacterium]